jgi:hypothetical protein
MIFDFGCREALGLFEHVLPAVPGALAVLAVVGGLAFIGRLFTRSLVFRASDVFVGWGIVAGIMTLAAVFFDKPLLLSAFGLFALMLVGLVMSVKDHAFASPFWILALFPGLFVLAVTNAVGLGGFAYDDFSHWVPNALYVFVHDDVPSKAMPSLHSIYPGYPHALPFLTYLASLLVEGFLVQGGAMINFLLLFVFAAMLAETTEKPNQSFVLKQSIGSHPLALTTPVLLFAVFLNSSISTFGITNQGDTGTMVLCGALGLMFWKLSEALRLKYEAGVKEYSLRLALTAAAFVLIKQSNIILFLLLLFSFLIIDWRNGVLKAALRKLPFILLPALVLHFIWQYYADVEIGGGGVSMVPLSAWRFDLFLPLLKGIWYEIKWKPEFFVLFLGSVICGVYSLFRLPTPLRNFALFSAIVQICYAVFLIVAFLGSDFTEYTIRYAASFHRYMLHAVFLALPTFWLAAPTILARVKIKERVFEVFPKAHIGVTILSLFILPFVASVETDWIVVRPNQGMCVVRNVGRGVAAVLPDKTQLGAVFPGDNGLMAFIVSLELAFQEAQTGRPMMMSWHSDNFHAFSSPKSSDVEKQLKDHPETNALTYSSTGYDLLRTVGIKDELETGLFVREGTEWKPKVIYFPQGADRKKRTLYKIYPPP